MSNKVQLIKEEIERIERILEDFNKTHNNTIDNGIVSAKKNICKHIKSFIDSLPEESGCEVNCTTKSEDLEGELRKILNEHYYFPDEDDELKSTPELAKYIAYFFAEWQKQQMMKDAVEGYVIYQIGSAEIAPIDIRYQVVSDRVYIPNVKLGDRVKIIIVKEE